MIDKIEKGVRACLTFVLEPGQKSCKGGGKLYGKKYLGEMIKGMAKFLFRSVKISRVG